MRDWIVDHPDLWLAAAGIALVLAGCTVTYAFLDLDQRLRRLAAEMRDLDGRPTIPTEGSGRRAAKTAWRTRAERWWATLRDAFARWRR